MKKQYISPLTVIFHASAQTILAGSIKDNGTKIVITDTPGSGDAGEAVAKRSYSVWDDDDDNLEIW